jgi:hypothetical protein
MNFLIVVLATDRRVAAKRTARSAVTDSADARELRKEIRRLRGRIDELESGE